MSLSDSLLQQLLYRSEGVDLDFKQAQYRFIGGDEAVKSELLKDILAIANSWRDGTGYILIGFKDRRPDPAEVVGIDTSERIDDAQLQQFVHGKVSPNLNFKYEERMFEGKRVGIISIPVQPRPFYISTKYGRVKSNVVYLRRGSSTAEASPLEVMKMGEVAKVADAPQVTIDVLNVDNGEHSLSANLRFLQYGELRDYKEAPKTIGILPVLGTFANSDYYRELASYAAFTAGSLTLKLRIGNHSAFPLKNCKFEFRILPQVVPHLIVPESDYPDKPKRTVGYSKNLPFFETLDKQVIRLRKKGPEVTGYARLDTILSGDEFVSEEFMIQLFEPCEFDLEVKVLAEQLSPPFIKKIAFTVDGEHITVNENMLLRDFPVKDEEE